MGCLCGFFLLNFRYKLFVGRYLVAIYMIIFNTIYRYMVSLNGFLLEPSIKEKILWRPGRDRGGGRRVLNARDRICLGSYLQHVWHRKIWLYQLCDFRGGIFESGVKIEF